MREYVIFDADIQISFDIAWSKALHSFNNQRYLHKKSLNSKEDNNKKNGSDSTD